MSKALSVRSRAASATRQGKAAPRRVEELMAVALDLFSERDFAAVTIKDIANAVGVNTALIYYYFENKEHLFRATIEDATVKALDNYRRVKERHTDPVDLINDWFDNNLELAEPIRKLVKIMLDYSSSGMQIASVDHLIDQFYEEECSILSSSIRRGIALGLFRRVDPDQTALFASTHLDGIMVASLIRERFDLKAAIASLKRLFWEHLGFPEGASRPVAPKPLEDAGS